MHAVYRLWVDPMENRDAYGYSLIGVVSSQEEANRINMLSAMLKEEHSWPLHYANEFPGDSVPRFFTVEVPNLDDKLEEELLHAENVHRGHGVNRRASWPKS